MMLDESVPMAEQKPSVPGWVVTFADLMSLLLAFFVLLFSFSEMDSHKYKQIAGSMQEAFGVQKSVPVKDIPEGVSVIAREFSPGIPSPTPLDTVRQMTTDDYHENPEPAPVTPSQDNAQQIQGYARHISEVLDKEISAGLLEVEIADKEVILRIQEKGSFPSGSSELVEPFHKVADKIALAFAGVPGAVVVSGHTDDIPIHNDRFRSNWELSASRAATIIHELSRSGKISPDRFRLAASGEMSPIDSNSTAEGRARNRRVEVTLAIAPEPSTSDKP